VEGPKTTGTESRDQQRALLARLWAVLDPAVDALPAAEVPGHVVHRICTGFGASAAALSLDGGERFGTPPGDPAWPAAAERIELDVQDGLGSIGCLELAFETVRTRDDFDRTALELAAARLGRAVARLHQEREAAVAEARLRAETHAAGRLYRISTALMAEPDLHDVVQRVTEETTALARAQFGAFFYNVLDDRGERYMLYTIAGVPRSAFEQFPMPRNTAVFDPTFRGERTVRSDDITADPRYGRSAPYHGMPDGHLPVRSYLAVPVKSRSGDVLGGLFFGHEQTGVFDEEAERQVVTVASLAALAIENASLHDTARRELDATRRAYNERDSVARVLQESLLPHRLPEIPGLELAARYAPGEGMVGGDFYDVFLARRGTFGATIADVQGKDSRAAAMTSVVRHTLRSAALQFAEPSAALEFVNEVVRQEQDVDDPRFCSAAFVLLTPREGGLDIRLSSAGHPPALVLRADGEVHECHFPGTLLGVIAAPELGDADCRLGPGDALVLYTDGLIEARSARAGMLGEERLRRALAAEAGTDAEQLATRLAGLAETYGGPRRDDLALLIVRVPDTV
jgi:serine phosphatase RsbU (regulator of sigma subunit)